MNKVRLKPRPSHVYVDLSYTALGWFVLSHAIAFIFLVPYAAWQSYFLALILHSIFGVAITLVAHRYFSHNAFRAPGWMENVMAVLYTLSFDRCGEGVISWVAGHKFHHAYPDHDLDPHSPIVGGYWHAYCGHYIWRRRDLYNFEDYKHYCPNLARKPFLVWLDRRSTVIGLQLVWMCLIFVCGGFIGPQNGFDTWMATSFVVWGVFGRYCFTQFSHSMVDTVSHGVGVFRALPDTCNTGTSAKNNLVYWFCTFGNETWHNIHHAFPRAASNGERWYRWDFDSFVMWFLQKLGLISGCKFLTEEDIEKRRRGKVKLAY